MIFTKNWHWIKLKIFLQKIRRVNLELCNQFRCNTCISYAPSQIALAKYLELLLNLAGFKVYLHQRSARKNDFLQFQLLGSYFLLVPEQYEELVGHTTSISRELESLVKEQIACKIFLIHTNRVDEILLESLVRFIEEKRVPHEIRQLDFTTLIQELAHPVDEIRGLIMSKKSPDAVKDIMTKEVVFVQDNAKFSDIYYKMTTVGIRHCPVISSEDQKCAGIVSRRDLISKIPPGNLFLPDAVVLRYGISKLDQTRVTRELMTLGKQKVKDVFQIGVNPVISLGSQDKIERAVKLFTTPHLLGGSYKYVGGLPVLDDEQRIIGFVSYVDIFKHVIRHKTDFLETTLVDSPGVATIPDNILDVAKLEQSDTLSNATTLLDNTGYRSLPVVADDSEDNLVGFVEDIQVKKYNHKLFGDQLGDLGVEGFMTPVDRLKVIEPKTPLSKFIEHFWEPVEGTSPSPSFAVCEIMEEPKGIRHHKLKGVVSYVDVLKAFDTWLRANPSQPNK